MMVSDVYDGFTQVFSSDTMDTGNALSSVRFSGTMGGSADVNFGRN